MAISRSVAHLRHSYDQNWKDLLALFKQDQVNRLELGRLTSRHEALKAELRRQRLAANACKGRIFREKDRLRRSP